MPARGGRAGGGRRQPRRHGRPGRGGGRRLLRRPSAAPLRQVRARECVPGRLRLGPRARLRRLRRDRRRLLTRPRRPAGAGGADRRRLRRLDRLPLRRGWFHPQLGVAPAPVVAGRQRLRLVRARVGRGRLDGRVPLLLGADLAPARPRPGPGRGVRLPDRDDLPLQAARCRHHRGADQLRGPGGRRVEDVHVHRGRGAGAGDLVGPGPAGRTVRSGSAAARVRGVGAPDAVVAAVAGRAPGVHGSSGSTSTGEPVRSA